MKIIFSGGGTIGSVSPLLAIYDEIKARGIGCECVWVGTRNGIEKGIIARKNIRFVGISAGKWRRYFSWKNIFDLFQTLRGFLAAIKIIRSFQPDLIISAGSFVSVPLVVAGWIFGIKSIIHQQDLRPGLANKIMSIFSSKITVAFAPTVKYFPARKTILSGNPVRRRIFSGDKARAMRKFGLIEGLPTVLVMGGSLGAEKINELILKIKDKLISFCQVIHVAGKCGSVKSGETARYHAYAYLHDELADAYACADLVVCRAGLSTLTELAALRKPMIIIPIPGNQQKDNADFFEDNQAAVVISQENLQPDQFASGVKRLLEDAEQRQELMRNLARLQNPDSAKHYLHWLLEEGLLK